MAEITKELGRVPISRGEFNLSTTYYKDNIVQYKRGSYQVVSKSPIIGVPPTNDKNVVNPGWTLFAGTLDAQDVVNQVKDQETKSIQAVATREAEILAKSDAAELSFNNTDTIFSGTNVQNVLKETNDKLSELESEVIYDVTANNNGATFFSLSALLSSNNLSTLIPTSVRHGGMSIRFVQSSDNKYVQYFLTKNDWSASEEDWQKMNLEEEISQLEQEIENIVGTPSVDFDLSQYTKQVGHIYDNVFKDTGNFGNFRFILIPVYDYVGRTLHIVPLSSSYGTLLYFLKDDVLINNQEVYFATGYPWSTLYKPADVVVPSDARYLWIRMQNVATETNYEPQSITINAESGIIGDLQEEVNGKVNITQGISSAGMILGIGNDGNVIPVTDHGKESKEQLNVIEPQLKDIEAILFSEGEETVDVQITIHKESNENGYWYSNTGGWSIDSTRRSSDKIDVTAGEKYLVTTKIGTSQNIAYLAQWNGDTWVGVATGFTGGSGDAVDREYIVPEGITKIAICSYNSTNPSLKKAITYKILTFYNKEETDAKFATKSEIPSVVEKYGVKWDVSDYNDLGARVFDAVGKSAAIGIGSTNGSSDFDNIYPWSEIKRCNIKVNDNGAKIVTFEGETGFALDGSNGDVFVRIPKFKTINYNENNYEYIVIGDGYVHPAFIEDGVELDEIFIGAFEASLVSNALYSKGGVIPANNLTGAEFLAYAKSRGANYTLYDMRAVDAVWRLMAVEFGCRNSNRILGYGYSDYRQADQNYAYLSVSVAVTNSNTITIGKPTNNSLRLYLLSQFAIGNNLTICDGSQTNIIAQRKITNVQCASTDDNIVISFSGAAIDITTSMFVGNAPITTNYCEDISEIDTDYSLSWHTGRANRPIVAGSAMDVETINPCRYRWIENPVGNVWHNLPDVTFYNGQMYICRNMKDYEILKHIYPYIPVGSILPIQDSNGVKNDINTVSYPNYWITSLLNDFFAKGNNFGKSFDDVHDGTLTSKKGYGGYYYLRSGERFIVNGGGFDHLWRCNILTNRAWQNADSKWFLYGGRLMFKNI